MKKRIIKTSEEAHKEMENFKNEEICPECGSDHVKLIDRSLKGFFAIKIIKRYRCINCLCEYEIERDFY